MTSHATPQANIAADVQQRLNTLRQKLERTPHNAALYNQLGLTLGAVGQIDAALEAFDRAIALSPTCGEAFMNRGLALEALRRDEDALQAFSAAVRLVPLYTEALERAAHTAARLGKNAAPSPWPRGRKSTLSKFFAGFRSRADRLLENPKAVKEPEWREVLKNDIANANYAAELGALLVRKERFIEAENFLKFALLQSATHTRATLTLAKLLEQLERPHEAIAVLLQAINAGDTAGSIYPVLLRLKQSLCAWQDYRSVAQRAAAQIQNAPESVEPFAALSLTARPADHLASARAQAASIVSRATPIARQEKSQPSKRITVGYLSADFHDHPVATLIAGLFEAHDKARFEVRGYALWMDDGSAVRQRIRRGCDHFTELWDMDARAAAQRIVADNVDILVDLTGYTLNGRADILAQRPAPIQVSYLGYPGTTGAPFMDYALVDRTIVAENDAQWYSEKLAFLPTYQINDRARVLPAQRVQRRDFGLPEKGAVFCCFNGTKKYTPEMFDAWMRILHAVPGSVLWLSGGSAADNLRREAAARGIAPERLAFTVWTPSYDAHLLRYQIADLFLDTLPYNAHTTASDALWMACPLLTCYGTAFPGRVAASVLKSAGLGELVTSTLDEYEALAVRLGNNPAELARLRRHLNDNRLKSPLFDTAKTTGQIEWAYRHMWENFNAGRAPESFTVPGQDF